MPSDKSDILNVLLSAVDFVASEQLVSGEIPARADHPAGQPEKPGPVMVSNIFITTFVVDSLRSVMQLMDGTLLQIEPKVNDIVSRGLDFLRREEEPDHVWRFLGRSSNIDPDCDCTSCAAACLRLEITSSQYVRSLERFRDHTGRYSSYRDGRGYRYSWIERNGATVQGYDRVVNANVARYLGLVGAETPSLWDWLQQELVHGDMRTGSRDYPNIVTFLYMMARAAEDGGYPFRPEALARLRAEIRRQLHLNLRQQRPLSLALAMSAGSLAGLETAPLRHSLSYLISIGAPSGSWAEEDFFVGGYRSQGLTTAIAAEAIARVLSA